MLLRFVHYALILGLFGRAAFRTFGISQLEIGARNGLPVALVVTLAIAAPVVTTALMLVSIAGMMGQPLRHLEITTVEMILVSTDLGLAYIVRLAALCAGGLALVFCGRSRRGRLLTAILYAVAIMTLTWSGHAAASEGALGTFHRLNDGVHLLAAGLWLGAIGWFLHLTVKAHLHPEQIAPEPALAAMHRFAPLGATLVAAVAVTGFINAQLVFGIENSGEVLGTAYGWILVVKLALVGLMLMCGFNNAVIGRRWARNGNTGASLIALRFSLAAELMIATGILAGVAILGTASPMG